MASEVSGELFKVDFEVLYTIKKIFRVKLASPKPNKKIPNLSGHRKGPRPSTNTTSMYEKRTTHGHIGLYI
jgi:hypothetical protein